MDQLFVKCDRAYRKGANIIILSDRGIDENHVAIPSLLAVSAIEHHLVRTKKRTAVSIILESAEPRDVHQFATLLGYGAQAINPYLAHECIAELIDKKMLDKDYHTAVHDYNAAILHGIVKIAAKMGISTLQSYQSAQIFEAIGLCKDVIDKYFTNTVSRVGGIGLTEIAEGVEFRHSHAFDPLGLGVDTSLDSIGFYKLRAGEDKEDHLYNAETIVALQQATQNGDYNRFKEYTAMVDNQQKPHTLRGLLEFVYPEDGGIPIEEVEPASEIVKRFKTGAMSYGSISEEAHECMAIAMNRLGGKSNSGEGGGKAGASGHREKQRHQAGGIGAVWRHQPVPSQRQGDPDQNGPGRKAGRRRASSRHQGLPLDRSDPLFHPRRFPDFAAASSRHLLHRGPGPADLRLEKRQPPGPHFGKACV